MRNRNDPPFLAILLLVLFAGALVKNEERATQILAELPSYRKEKKPLKTGLIRTALKKAKHRIIKFWNWIY